jgi:hypothetical protein
MSGEVSFEKQKALGADLQATFGAGGPIDRVTDWAGSDPGRQEFVDATVFATIRWNRVRGRPKDGPLASGFRVLHNAERWDMWTVERSWDYLNDVSTFDLPEEGDHHRVGLACPAIPFSAPLRFTGKNNVFVYPAGVEWVSVERPPGLGDPNVGYGNWFTGRVGGGVILLPDFVFD